MKKLWGSLVILALASSAGCTEDRCPDDPRMLLEDTPVFRGCKGDAIQFRPNAFSIGGAHAADAGAVADGGVNDGRDSELGAIYVSSPTGVTRSHVHLYVYECKEGGLAANSNLIRLEPVDDGCTINATQWLSCRTNDLGFANFRVQREEGKDGDTRICATTNAAADAGVQHSPSAEVAVASGVPQIGGLGFDFLSRVTRRAEGDAGTELWTLPAARLACIAAPQSTDCTDTDNRSISLSVTSVGTASQPNGVAPIIVQEKPVPVTFALEVEQGDGWLSTTTCSDTRQSTLSSSIQGGSSSSDTVLLCTTPAGGRFRIKAGADGSDHPTATTEILVEPSEYAVVFGQAMRESSADAGTSTYEIAAHLEAPCGGSLDGVTVGVRAVDDTSGKAPMNLASAMPTSLSIETSTANSLSIDATRDPSSKCTANLTVSGAAK